MESLSGSKLLEPSSCPVAPSLTVLSSPASATGGLFTVGEEGGPVHRPIQNHGGGEPIQAQTGGKGGCLPMSMRDRGTAAFTTLLAAAQAGHLGRCPGLIDEHQAEGIEIGLPGEPGQPARRDVRPVLLGGVRGFF